MWFGNLATFKYWDDYWLYEGFASYLSYKRIAESGEYLEPFKDDIWIDWVDLKGWGISEDIKIDNHKVCPE